MAGSCGLVIDDLLYNCNDKSTGGIEQELKLVNLSDLRAHITEFTINDSTTQHTISAFAGTAADLNAVKVEAIPNKQLLRAGFVTTETDYGTYVNHQVDIWTQAVTEKSMLFLKALVNGGEVAAFIKQKVGPNSLQETYWIYGFTKGLKLNDTTFSSSENSGSFIVPLSSKEPDLEPTLPYRILITDLPTTKAFFDAL
ncbi:MAG: hypothetical protein ACRCU6_04055 [Fusobacteriaceae bacterium]